jgi:RNA polymerase sigma-70 factor (ECF subfamily)
VRTTVAREPRTIDPESAQWLDQLRADGHVREQAVQRLHELLLRAARFEVARRSRAVGYVRADEVDNIAQEAAADAVVAVLARLERFRGLSRFTTWAYKFALLEAAVKVRRRAWQGRELPLAADGLAALEGGSSPQRGAEQAELIAAIRDSISTALTQHQREVLVALTLNEVPIDVLADRLGSTRGALYKTLHDARRKLRADLEQKGVEWTSA